MDKKIFFTLIAGAMLACLTHCELEDPVSGDLCDNLDGLAVEDYLEAKNASSNSIVSQSIRDTGRCVETYPYCITVSKREYCSSCPKPKVLVNSGKSFDCMSCSELQDCTTKPCMEALVNKCGECIEGCWNNELITCDPHLGTIRTPCDYGCNDDNTECSTTPIECKVHKVPVKGECVCDKDNLWLDNGKGGCKCMDGYEKINGECVSTACELGAVYDDELDRCVCDDDNGWTGKADDCVCKMGYLQSGKICKSIASTCDPVRQVFDSDANACVCNADRNWVFNKNAKDDEVPCACADGYVFENNSCIVPGEKLCGPRQVLKDGECVCDTDNNFVSDDADKNKCVCKDGYQLMNGICQLNRDCDFWFEIFDDDAGQCVCDKNQFRVEDEDWKEGDDGFHCKCMDGYVSKNTKCESIASCTGKGQIIDEISNTCICDEKENWIPGEEQNCVCKNGYTEIDGVCKEIPACNKPGQSYQSSTNTCICDEQGHWVEKNGACDCDSGFTFVNNACVENVSCDGKGLVYDKNSNTCKCDTDNHWTEDGSACKCAFGYKESNGSCIKYTAGQTFSFGQYYYNSNDVSTKKTINWIILSVDSNAYLLLSEKTLDTKAFGSSNVWKDSSLRTWLNNSFLNTAFDSNDKTHIKSTSLSDVGTTDKIFVLKVADVDGNKSYSSVNTASKRVVYGTPYAISQGATAKDSNDTVKDPGKCTGQCRTMWWLRDSNTVSGTALTKGVRTSGEIPENGFNSNTTDVAVRPALWVKF